MFTSEGLRNSIFTLAHTAGQPVFRVCWQTNLLPQTREADWEYRAQFNTMLNRFRNYTFMLKHWNERRSCKLLFNGTNQASAELVLWAQQRSVACGLMVWLFALHTCLMCYRRGQAYISSTQLLQHRLDAVGFSHTKWIEWLILWRRRVPDQ
jgi:hypothetical protein